MYDIFGLWATLHPPRVNSPLIKLTFPTDDSMCFMTPFPRSFQTAGFYFLADFDVVWWVVFHPPEGALLWIKPTCLSYLWHYGALSVQRFISEWFFVYTSHSSFFLVSLWGVILSWKIFKISQKRAFVCDSWFM